VKPTAAEGCAWCDVPRRDHCQRWHMGIGFHGWVAPSKSQIAARIRRRFQAKGWLPR
jgi:hypothetical protein